jgi:formylmethanofuran dehydrogenase subunit E
MLQEMPDQIASTNTEIHIDQDVTQNSGSNMNQNTCETNTDKQVSIINNQTTEDSHKIATETKKIIYTPISLKHMPKINVGTLQENKQSENLAVIEYKNAKENKDFNWKEMNITYVKNTPENNSKIKFPKNFNEMDATLAELDKKYNPILKLREAKEELLAINVQKLFNK